jgi:transposase-like protein
VPFHCPYCGDEDLRPHEATDGTSPHGAWECRSCLRAFSLRMLGVLARPGSVTPAPADRAIPDPDGEAAR